MGRGERLGLPVGSWEVVRVALVLEVVRDVGPFDKVILVLGMNVRAFHPGVPDDPSGKVKVRGISMLVLSRVVACGIVARTKNAPPLACAGRGPPAKFRGEENSLLESQTGFASTRTRTALAEPHAQDGEEVLLERRAPRHAAAGRVVVVTRLVESRRRAYAAQTPTARDAARSRPRNGDSPTFYAPFRRGGCFVSGSVGRRILRAHDADRWCASKVELESAKPVVALADP